MHDMIKIRSEPDGWRGLGRLCVWKEVDFRTYQFAIGTCNMVLGRLEVGSRVGAITYVLSYLC